MLFAPHKRAPAGTALLWLGNRQALFRVQAGRGSRRKAGRSEKDNIAKKNGHVANSQPSVYSFINCSGQYLIFC